MPKIVVILISIVSLITMATGQTQQRHPPEGAPEDIVRITTELVQTDVVVTDKNDQIIPDLKLEDFELYEKGKRQDIKFLEFVRTDAEPRTEGTINVAGHPVEPDIARNLTARDLRR